MSMLNQNDLSEMFCFMIFNCLKWKNSFAGLASDTKEAKLN